VKRDNLGKALADIEQIGIPGLAQKFRQELMALGWYPIEQMDAGQLAFITFVRWVSRR